jgi:AcrR family transcriptional regulator
MAGRPKKQENRRELILQTAHQLFDHYGFEKTTLEDIAKAAGIGKGTIYLDFANKDEILMGCITHFHQQELVQMEAFISAQPVTATVQTLKTVVMTHILTVFDAVSKSIHSPEALATTSNRVKAEMQDFFITRAQYTARLLTQGAEAGLLLPQENPQITAKRLWMALSCFFPPYWPGADREQVAQHAEGLLDLIIVGLSVR